MNKASFLRYIENDRDCDQDRLGMAVNKGLHKAKNDKFNAKKLFMLAAANVFIFVICINLNFITFSTLVDGYYRNRQKTMPGSSEMLNGYIKDISCNLEKYLGGE